MPFRRTLLVGWVLGFAPGAAFAQTAPPPTYAPSSTTPTSTAPPVPVNEAETPGSEVRTPSGLVRELDGHVFTPTQLLVDPFTDSWTGSTATVGRSYFGGLALAGSDLRVRSLVGVYENFTLQLGLADFIAIRGTLGGQFYLGPGVSDVYRYGSSAQLRGGGGLTLSGVVAPGFRMGVTFDVDYGARDAVDYLGALTSSLTSATTDAAPTLSALSAARSTRVLPGFTFAIAMHPMIGLLASAQYLHSFAPDALSATANNAFLLGAALDLDFHAVSPLPLGLGASYRAIIPWGGFGNPEHDFNAGLYFTGEPHVLLGAELVYRYYQAAEADRSVLLSSLGGQAVVRFYF